MTKRKEYKHVLITDEDGKVMAWHEPSHQLCYCTNQQWQDEHHPAVAYTIAKAKEYIRKTLRNRKRWKMKSGNYKLMPFDMPKRKS